MSRRLFYILLTVALAATAAFAAFSNPAAATPRTITVQLGNGQVISITIDVPPGTPLDQIQLPGEVVPPGTPSTPAPAAPAPAPSTPGQTSQPKSNKGEKQKQSGSKDKAEVEQGDQLLEQGQAEVEPQKKDKKTTPQTPLRNPDGSPSPSNPTSFDALPGTVVHEGRSELRHPQVPRSRLPPADLPGGRDPVRRALGDPRRDQRDRDRLRAQPERLLRGRDGLDAVHPLLLEGLRRRRQQGRPQGPLQPGRRDLRRRALPQGRRLREGRPPRDLRLQPRRLVRRLGDAAREADRRRPG